MDVDWPIVKEYLTRYIRADRTRKNRFLKNTGGRGEGTQSLSEIQDAVSNSNIDLLSSKMIAHQSSSIPLKQLLLERPVRDYRSGLGNPLCLATTLEDRTILAYLVGIVLYKNLEPTDAECLETQMNFLIPSADEFRTELSMIISSARRIGGTRRSKRQTQKQRLTRLRAKTQRRA